MDFFIGIDVGSTSVRGGLFDSFGKLSAHNKRSIKIWNPEADVYEQSSEDIWNSISEVIKELKLSLKEGDHIGGISFDATCSLVVLDRQTLKVKSVSSSGEPGRNIMMWMDHRAHQETEEVNATQHKLLNFVGGAVSIEMQIPKILWLKKKFGEDFLRSSLFFDLADFLTFKCTGNNTRSLCTVTCKWLFDGENGAFNSDFFQSLGLEALVEPNSEPIGQVFAAPGTSLHPGLCTEAAAALELPAGCPVAAGLIDAYAGVLGSLFCRGHDAEVDTRLVMIAGTSTCHMTVSKKCTFVEGIWGPFLSTVLPNQWVLEGGQSAAGSLLDRISDLFGCPSVPEMVGALELLRQERGLTHISLLTENVHLLPDFHGNRSPLADPNLKGMISGLSLKSSIEEGCVIYLAAVQALAMGTRHILEVLEATRGYPVRAAVLCGGLRHNELFVRSHADALGLPLLLPRMEESVLLGTAMLAKMAAREGAAIEDVAMEMAGEGDVWNPNDDLKSFFDKKYMVFKMLIKFQQTALSIMKS